MATSFGPGALASQTSVLQANEDRMLTNLNGKQVPSDHSKIEKSSQQFEAMLLATWMQQAEQSMATVPGAEDDEDAAGREQLMGLGVQSVTTALASTGGIGIGRMIANAMDKMAEKSSPQDVVSK